MAAILESDQARRLLEAQESQADSRRLMAKASERMAEAGERTASAQERYAAVADKLEAFVDKIVKSVEKGPGTDWKAILVPSFLTFVLGAMAAETAKKFMDALKKGPES